MTAPTAAELSPEKLPWLEGSLQGLKKLVEQERFPSALLLHGAPGIGKLQLARRVRDDLLCLESIAGSACGTCRSCLLHAGGAHPDSLVVMPEDTGKPIKVDQIRSIPEFVYSRPQISRRRVLVLYPAEAMNINASNALLKTLEEPADRTHIVLVSDRPASLLPTIRSRCFKWSVMKPVREQALSWLSSVRPDSPAEQREAALQLAFGAPLLALALMSEENEEKGAILGLSADWKAFLTGGEDAFSLAERWSSMDEARSISQMMAVIRDQALSIPELGMVWHELYAELEKMMRASRENRHLNMQMQWESWLMLSKQSTQGKA